MQQTTVCCKPSPGCQWVPVLLRKAHLFRVDLKKNVSIYCLIFSFKILLYHLNNEVSLDSLTWRGHCFVLLQIIHPDRDLSVSVQFSLMGCIWMMHSLLDKTETCRCFCVPFFHHQKMSCVLESWSSGQTNQELGIFCFVTWFHQFTLWAITYHLA